MGQPQLDAQRRRGVFMPQGLPGSCLERPWFQQVHGYPCGFVSTWSGLHSPLLVVCASGLIQVEQNLVAPVCQPLQVQQDHQSLELISAWETVTRYLPAEAMGKEARVICFPKPLAAPCVSSASENSTPPF